MSKQKKVKHHKKGTQPVDSKFREVDMAIFSRWPWAMQMQYLAMRDMDSAEKATSQDQREWYQQRAQSYLDDLAAGQVSVYEQPKGQSEEVSS